jgi:hypothetical protein
MKFLKKYDFFTFKEPLDSTDWADFGISFIYNVIPRTKRGTYLGRALVTRGLRLKLGKITWGLCVSYHTEKKLSDLW